MEYYNKDGTILYQGDSLDIMKAFPDNYVTAIVTDPPYGLSFMGKKWDYDVPSVEMFAEMLRVLKPGGTMLCFAGSRTQHRMAVNIEDAGFVLKDTIMWLYGSGFPKSLNIGKAVDKSQGSHREVISKQHRKGRSSGILGKETDIIHINDKGTSGWDGYGTALKPSYEPILICMKPNDKTYANNALTHGVAGLNIDGCRIGTDDIKTCKKHKDDSFTNPYNGDTRTETARGWKGCPETVHQGRFPANIILDEEAGRLLDGQSGTLKSGKMFPTKTGGGKIFKHKKAGFTTMETYADKGGASRFYYCAKASKAERNRGCENLEEKKSSKLGDGIKSNYGNGEIGKTESADRKASNFHPTVKPLALMTYLTKLVKMPENTLILDPFAGSGSTLVACVENGINCIGIEREAEYCEIAKCRIIAARVDDQLRIDL